MKNTPLIALAALFALTGSAHALNKCKDAAGRTTYQDAPCPKNQKASTVEVKDTSRGVVSPKMPVADQAEGKEAMPEGHEGKAPAAQATASPAPESTPQPEDSKQQHLSPQQQQQQQAVINARREAFKSKAAK